MAIARRKDAIPQRLFELIANYTYDWESWLSPEGRLLWVNPAVERVTGYSVAECLTMRDYPLPIAEAADQAALAAHLAAARAGHSGNDVEFRIRRKDGTIGWVAMSWQMVYGEAGEVLGFRTSMRDIARRKEAEQQRESLRHAAEAANLAKSKFLAAASHDLRQPIQAAALFVAALKRQTKTGLTAELVEQLRLCLASTQELLDALLDISRLDAQTLKIEPRLVALSDLFERLETEFREPAQEKGLRLRSVASSHFVHSDPVVLYRILQNLVSNAVRYTRQGGVLIGARRQGQQVSIEVVDSGIGIAASDVPMIFREFHQLDSGGEGAKGLGLGLAIVDRLSAILGARLSLRSEPGRGSSFRVILPLASDAAVMEQAQASRPEPSKLRGLKIAVLDDDSAVLSALQHFLEGEGAIAIGARSLQELERQLRAPAHPPDLLLVDYRLSGRLDGPKAIARLRARLRRSLPALILTGETLPERLRKAETSGFTVLHKPIRPQQLIDAIARTLAS